MLRFSGGSDDVGVEITSPSISMVPALGARKPAIMRTRTKHRDVIVLADIVYFPGLAEAAHPSDFDIHDAAGAGFDGGGRVAGVADGLVQANGGSQFALQPGVVVDVVIPQRLLDHQELEAIKFAQVFDFIEGVGGVGIAAQHNIGPARADPFQHVHVPARLYFDLDAAVSGGEFGLDLVQQLLDRILDPDGDAALDLASRASEQLP